jgi:hypothetical protein
VSQPQTSAQLKLGCDGGAAARWSSFHARKSTSVRLFPQCELERETRLPPPSAFLAPASASSSGSPARQARSTRQCTRMRGRELAAQSRATRQRRADGPGEDNWPTPQFTSHDRQPTTGQACKTKKPPQGTTPAHTRANSRPRTTHCALCVGSNGVLVASFRAVETVALCCLWLPLFFSSSLQCCCCLLYATSPSSE